MVIIPISPWPLLLMCIYILHDNLVAFGPGVLFVSFSFVTGYCWYHRGGQMSYRYWPVVEGWVLPHSHSITLSSRAASGQG